MANRILVVDDEKLIVKGLKFSLEQDEYEVGCAYDGEQAVSMVKSEPYDVMLLDLMLPKMDGLTVCRTVREFSDIPIIMLTAKGDDMDKIMGLEYGADDYITKPFNILEVKARIRAILRRRNSYETRKAERQKKAVTYGAFSMDFDARSVKVRDREVGLTAKEFDLLEILVKNPGRVYSREELLRAIWGDNYPGDARTVDVHIRRLREKLESNPSSPDYVHTKWGVGYYFHALDGQ